VVLRELLPPESGDAPERSVSSRREARRPHRRRTGPILAAGAVLLATAGASFAVLGSGPRTGTDLAYPGGSRTAGTTGRPGTAAGQAAATQAAAPADVTISRAGTAGTTMPAGRAYSGAPWPALAYTLQATTNGMRPAPFPVAVPGYRLSKSWAASATVTADRHFAAVGGLPVRTTSWGQCRTQRFYLRWQASDPRAVVDASFVDAAVRTVQNSPVHGAGGWMSSYGCVQPALRIRPGAGPATATVTLQVQVWNRG
jgi:hypothetical protein